MTGEKTGSGRRGFLKSVLVAGGGLAALGTGGAGLLTKLARADAGDGFQRHYVFCYFGGGWDILLGLDPRDPARFTEARIDETRIELGYDRLPGAPTVIRRGDMLLGPYMGDLANHADKLAIVRGMSMETLTHESGRRRFITGKPPAGLQARGSSGAVWLAARLGADNDVPNLSIGVESYNRELPSFASALRASDVPDVVRALTFDDPQLVDEVDQAIDATLTASSDCDAARHSPFFRKAQALRQQARRMVASGVASRFDFLAMTPEMEAIRTHFGIDPAARDALATPEARGALAVTAITSGISRCVSIAVAGGLDTHNGDDWETDQGPGQQRGFNIVARMIEKLAATEYEGGTGESWLDHTVIVGFSEFSRTSLLNARGGRDHSLTNACFLAGGRVAGGTVIGASSDVGMAPQPVDLTTGRVDMGGEVLKPEHVLQTLFEDAGLGDEPDMRASGLPGVLTPP